MITPDALAAMVANHTYYEPGASQGSGEWVINLPGFVFDLAYALAADAAKLCDASPCTGNHGFDREDFIARCYRVTKTGAG
jgi:hypothetical protein